MRKFILLLLTAVSINAAAQSTDPSPYCAAGYDDGMFPLEHYISRVTFGSLDNNSGTTVSPGNHYIFYNNLSVENFTVGNTYTLVIANDGGVVHFAALYIDYNDDHDFDDAGEKAYEYTGNLFDPVNGTPSLTSTVTIPAGTAPGNKRMRVVLFEDDGYTFGGATTAVSCTAFDGGSLDYGETEDYTINLVGPVTGTEKALATLLTNSVYPNPSSSAITVDMKLETSSVVKVTLSDMMGKEVMTVAEGTVQELNTTVPVEALQKGTYTVNYFINGTLVKPSLLLIN